MKSRAARVLLLSLSIGCFGKPVPAQVPAPTVPEKVIFDTDIGDDIDDAFALGLLISSHDVRVLGVTTGYGDTDLRARLTARLLCDVGKTEIPVTAGPKTPSTTPFSQTPWAQQFPEPLKPWPDAIDFLSRSIRANPRQITLIAVAPFTNLGALIERDPATFHLLKRVVIMGGSIRRGYDDPKRGANPKPDAEYNIAMDVPAAKKLFSSGVPLYVMPLDSTQLYLTAANRSRLFQQSKPLAADLSQLSAQWSTTTHMTTPILFDAMAVAYALEPGLCPTRPMHLVVDDQGYTREQAGAPNAQVCLASSSRHFFDFYMRRLLDENLHPPAHAEACTEPPRRSEVDK